MVNYIDSFKRPFADAKKFLIGAVLSLIPIVNLLAIGYYIKLSKTAAKAKPSFKLPEWENWSDLFVKGLLSVIINLIYALPAIILIFLSIGNMMITQALTSPAAFLSALGPGMIFAGILALLAAYITPLAVIHFINTDKFSNAFDLKKLTKKALTTTYALPWLVATVYSIVIAGVLGLIPYVGAMIGSFIAGVTMFTLLGQAYYEAK